MRKFALAIMALLVFAAAPAVACSKYGVWKGIWSMGSYSGPVELTISNKL